MPLPLPMLTRRAAIRRLRKAEAEVKRLERRVARQDYLLGKLLQTPAARGRLMNEACWVKRDGYACAKWAGHDGDHVARGEWGEIYRQWPQKQTP